MKRQILKNIFSVGGVQMANYLLPLLTLPYIVRIVGPEKYGRINFAAALIGYFTLFINYGFDLTATREIAQKRDDIVALSKIFWNIIAAKVFLFVMASVVFVSVLFFSPKLQLDPRLYLLTYAVTIGAIFFPTWFYQGIEELSKAAMFNLIIKIIFTVLVFILIQQESDYFYFPVCVSIGQVVVGLAAFWYAIKMKKFPFPALSPFEVFAVLKKSSLVFLTTVVIHIYTLSNIVLLGFLSTDKQVGFFSSSFRLISVVNALVIVPVTQTLYPHLGGMFAETGSKDEKSFTLSKVALVMGGWTLIVSLATFLFAPLAVHILFGKSFEPAVGSLRIMSFLPFIIGLSNVFGIQGMLNLKLDKELFSITAFGAALCIALNVTLIPTSGQSGTALAWFVTEIFITCTTYMMLWKRGYKVLTVHHVTKFFESRYV
ncbi:MAG: flippase [Bacteroidota bacterium]|nr:flippase [Bacteroidota bacterium]